MLTQLWAKRIMNFFVNRFERTKVKSKMKYLCIFNDNNNIHSNRKNCRQNCWKMECGKDREAKKTSQTDPGWSFSLHPNLLWNSVYIEHIYKWNITLGTLQCANLTFAKRLTVVDVMQTHYVCNSVRLQQQTPLCTPCTTHSVIFRVPVYCASKIGQGILPSSWSTIRATERKKHEWNTLLHSLHECALLQLDMVSVETVLPKPMP